MELKTLTGTIFGTLLLPASSSAPQPVPVVLIIAGSGPTDRNGNSPLLPGGNNSLKLLAEGLAEKGIASVRYDKRGVAESVASAQKEEDLRFETYIADVVAWGKTLKADSRFSSVGVLGHSEGSLIGMVAAQQFPADFFISIAGVGRPAQETLMEQLKVNLPADLYEKSKKIVASLVAGKTVKDPPPALAVLFRPSVQPYLISWFRYDAGKELPKLKAPTLLIQGTTDIQIGLPDAKLLSKVRPDAKLTLIEEMNHVLKTVPKGDNARQQAAYVDPKLPLAPGLIDAICTFVKP